MTGAPHISVMAEEAVAALTPKPGGVYVDATFGAGGYARAILNAAPCTVYAFDRDPTAIERAQDWIADFCDRLILLERPFADMEDALAEYGVRAVDGVVFDLGVSSMQLDEGARGFSFLRDGPLSMRMDGAKPDAQDVVATASEGQLIAIFRTYGEEKRARVIARAIIAARDETPITTTTMLAAIVEKAAPKAPGSKIHAATRVFQGLRIYVNDELGQLVQGLHAAECLLRPDGKLSVVTFHSLEDRIVKQFLKRRSARRAAPSRFAPPPQDAGAPSFNVVKSKHTAPSDDEIARNPRARSAKLRVGERRNAPVFDDEADAPLFSVPPILENIIR
ncbi:MAG: 16S rRNA (cytosine(1402)-N(4))-methyltransferase RsmH [Pseudomonadota bacterium]